MPWTSKESALLHYHNVRAHKDGKTQQGEHKKHTEALHLIGMIYTRTQDTVCGLLGPKMHLPQAIANIATRLPWLLINNFRNLLISECVFVEHLKCESALFFVGFFLALKIDASHKYLTVCYANRCTLQ